MQNTNYISALKKYIENHIGDDCGAWEYLHTPHITEIVGSLDKNDSNLLSQNIFNWPINVLYELADPIILGGNKYLKVDYLYCKIFSLTDEFENLEYLAQNLGACFYSLKSNEYDIEMFKAIKIRLISVSERSDEHWKKYYVDLLKLIDNIIQADE